MQSQFESLRDRLLKGGVAPRYVRRYIAELSEHAADIAAETERDGHPHPGETAMARLGKIDDLAQAMIARKELRSWAVRAPWAAFLLAPSLVLVGIDVVSIVAMVLLTKILMPSAGTHPTPAAPEWFAGLAGAMNGFHAYVVPLMLGWSIALLATRQRMRPLWPTIGLVAVACLAAANQLHITLPVTPNTPGEVSLGIEMQTSILPKIMLNIVLTVPVYFAWRRWREVRA